MTERQENHEKVAHTIVKESGKRSIWKFFINWKTLNKKMMTLTKSTVSKAIDEKKLRNYLFVKLKLIGERKTKTKSSLKHTAFFRRSEFFHNFLRQSNV